VHQLVNKDNFDELNFLTFILVLSDGENRLIPLLLVYSVDTFTVQFQTNKQGQHCIFFSQKNIQMAILSLLNSWFSKSVSYTNLINVVIMNDEIRGTRKEEPLITEGRL
jgi:hypothetical protein